MSVVSVLELWKRWLLWRSSTSLLMHGCRGVLHLCHNIVYPVFIRWKSFTSFLYVVRGVRATVVIDIICKIKLSLCKMNFCIFLVRSGWSAGFVWGSLLTLRNACSSDGLANFSQLSKLLTFATMSHLPFFLRLCPYRPQPRQNSSSCCLRSRRFTRASTKTSSLVQSSRAVSWRVWSFGESRITFEYLFIVSAAVHLILEGVEKVVLLLGVVHRTAIVLGYACSHDKAIDIRINHRSTQWWHWRWSVSHSYMRMIGYIIPHSSLVTEIVAVLFAETKNVILISIFRLHDDLSFII